MIRNMSKKKKRRKRTSHRVNNGVASYNTYACECDKYDNGYLVYSFTASGHPIRHLNIEERTIYIKAVGEVLSSINNKKLSLPFNIWQYSLIPKSQANTDHYASDSSFLAKAISFFGSTTERHLLCIAIAFDSLTLVEKVLGDTSFYIVNIISLLKGNKLWENSVNYAYSSLKGIADGCKLPEVIFKQWHKEKSFEQKKEKRVVFAANMSAGKSTVINAIVGHKINKVQSTACTGRVHYIHNKLRDTAAMVMFGNDNYIYTDDYSLVCSDVIEAVALNFNSELGNERICLIDTPGVNFCGDLSHREITYNVIMSNEYDLLVILLNATQLAISSEFEFLKFAANNCKRKIIFVLNKLDCFNPENYDSIEEAITIARQMIEECGIKNPIIIPISGLCAFLVKQCNIPYITQTDSSDEYTLHWFEHHTKSGYFDIPKYTSSKYVYEKGDKLLWYTGLPLLEKTIIDTIK